jgi:hypothetical protein
MLNFNLSAGSNCTEIRSDAHVLKRTQLADASYSVLVLWQERSEDPSRTHYDVNT